MKHTHRHPTLDQLVATLPPEYQHELASFLVEHACNPAIKLLDEGAKKFGENEAKYARIGALEEGRRTDLQKLAAFELHLTTVKNAVLEGLTKAECRESRAIQDLEAARANEHASSVRSFRWFLFSMGALVLIVMTGLYCIAHYSGQKHRQHPLVQESTAE